ncbi:hypothetical protein Prudu_013026 [Prunus dulcis]|uniref:Uncharacterized protein n=1 Tax=Prunus dulcis TaxID=3755 RepID=A0A4Y1RF05_PRUDU|nr:hypothetical protein Prudu_013026 [Prunus dulcis]
MAFSGEVRPRQGRRLVKK